MTEFYKLSAPGRRDLDAIWCYIAKDNPAAADRVEQELFEAMDLIGEHPHIGHSREDITPRNVKFWSVRHYMIVYRPNTKPVRIQRIISSYRDIGVIINPL